MRDIPNFALAPEEFIASGDTVAVVVRYTGTGKDTGKELDLPVVHVWDVRNGKLAQFRQFMDTAKFLSKSWPPPKTRTSSPESKAAAPGHWRLSSSVHPAGR